MTSSTGHRQNKQRFLKMGVVSHPTNQLAEHALDHERL